MPVYIAPAVTPESGNNPSFRVYVVLEKAPPLLSLTFARSYEYNRTTGEILDYVQYIGNLSDVGSSMH